MPAEGAQESDSRFTVECLHRTKAPVTQLYAHWGRACALDPRGDLLVCSAEGAPEHASEDAGFRVRCACWSPCGGFLLLGDDLGRIRLFHLPSQCDVWSHSAAEAHGSGGGPVPVFAEASCFEEPPAASAGGAAAVTLLVLQAHGALLRLRGLALAPLDAALRAAAAEGHDARLAVEGFAKGVSASTHAVPEDTRRFCVAPAAPDARCLTVYTCGTQEIRVHGLAGGALSPLDAAELPVFAGSGAACAEDGAEGDVELVHFGLWQLCPHSPCGESLEGRGGCSPCPVLALASRRPGLLVLCEPELLFEVHRWGPPGGAGVLAAAQVAAPPARAAADEHGDGAAALGAGRLAACACVILDTCELVVCLVPPGTVLLTARLGFGSPTAALLAVPDRCESAAAFACCTTAGAPQNGAAPTAISVLRFAAEDDPQDNSVDLEELLEADDAGGLDARTTASLRQQMELLIERAAEGRVELRAAPVLRLARQLVAQIPGFVVGSIVRAGFADAAETREALRGLVPLLRGDALPATYDAKKGAALVTESLARLTTFESLHCALAPPAGGEPRRAAPPERGRAAKSRRCSLADCRLGGSPGRAAPRGGAAAAGRRRHSLPSFGQARVLLKEDLVGRSAVEVLLQLGALSGSDFGAAWQHFRRAALPQVCSDLIALGRVPEAFDVLSRHGSRFTPDEVMQVFEALPFDLDAEEERRLPHRVVHQAARLAPCRAQLMRWLTTRAELLEARLQAPDAALHLLGTLVASAAPEHCRPAAGQPYCPLAAALAREGAQAFPEARVASGALWCGSPPPLASAGCWARGLPPRGGAAEARPGGADDDGVDTMLELFRQLLCCAHVRQTHGLRLGLQELRGPGAERLAAAKLLDRALAPELVAEEVRAHVGPLCEWSGVSLDDVLGEYVAELADSFALPNGEVRLERAAAVLRCVGSVDHRARGLVGLLQRWGGAEVPPELKPLVDESAAWPACHSRAVREQLALAELQRMLRKYGLGGGCVTYPLYNARLVSHLLSRVDGDAGPLQDALAIIGIFPQHFSRAEALFLCLSHVASAVEGGGAPPEVLQRRADLALGCASSGAERRAAAAYFATYCCDLLGEWACAIQSGQAGATRGQAAALKSCSSALCALAIGLSHSVLLAPEDAAGDDPRRDAGDGAFDLFARLRGLHDEFDLFLDPLDISRGPAEPPQAAGACGPRAERPAVELFRRQAARLLGDAGGDAACGGDGARVTRLLRLGQLLGLAGAHARQLAFLEACPRGLAHLCAALLPRMLECRDAEGLEGLAGFVREALRRICEARPGVWRPAELLLQLAQVEETISGCLCRCPPSDMAALLGLAGDVQLAMETLLSSDLLDAAGRGPAEGTELESLPTAHAHYLGSLLASPAPEASCAAAAPRASVLQKTFVEIPLLIPGATAAQAGLDYLSSTRAAPAAAAVPAGPRAGAAAAGAPRPRALAQLLAALRASECLELAASLLLRHPGSFDGSDLRQLCRDRGTRVLRAGNGVDHQLALAYMGCLDSRDARDMLVSALSYLRTEQLQTEHHRLQRLARLGGDLAVLWGTAKMRDQMARVEIDARWSQCLSVLRVPFDAALLGDRGASLRALTSGRPQPAPEAEAEAEAAAHARALVPRLACATGFDLGAVLRFGRDHGLPEQEVLALWVEVAFAVRSVRSAEARDLQGLVSPALERLPGMVREEILVARVLPALSPYAYESIAFLLGLVKHHPLTQSRVRVLRVLERHARARPPAMAERREIVEWASRVEQLLPGGPEGAEALREVQLLAERRLPWHSVALSGDPWPALAPELTSFSAFRGLLVLAEPLGIDAGGFHVCMLRRLAASGAGALEDGDGDLAGGEEDRLSIESLVLEVPGAERALSIAAELEEGAPLGPRRLALARSRLALAQRLAAERGGGDPDGLVAGSQRRLALLESRWDLARSGLGLFDGVLVELGPAECAECLYYYAPASLLWPRGPDAAPAALADAARALGEEGVHRVVDDICNRHGVAPKALRHRLLEQWLVDPTRRPQGAPPALADAEAAHLGRLARPRSGGAASPGAAAGGDGAAPPPAQRPRLSAARGPAGAELFSRDPADLLCLDRATWIAWPRHAGTGQDMPKDVREDVWTRGVFLLRIVFKKEKDVSYDAKCRALEVFFRITPPEDISAVYRNPVEELREIWKLYFYMDAFERLGAPQDFKRFYQCSKDGMARSLWRSHQSDPRMVQVIAALCLDFSVRDGGFWASVLAGLHAHSLREFARDVLVALHEGLILDMPHEEALVAAVCALVDAPLAALEAWAAAGAPATPPQTGGILPLLPHILRRSPFAADLQPAALASRLLRLARAPGLAPGALGALAAAALGEAPGAAAAARGEAAGGCEEASGALGALAFEVALCDASHARLRAFVCEEVMPHCPRLMLDCVPRCTGAARAALFQGILACGLAAEARLQLPDLLFGELVEHAIAGRDVRGLLEAALAAGELEGARRLLARFARVHRLPPVGRLLEQAGEGGGAAGGEGAAAQLLGTLRALSASEAVGEGCRELLRDLCSPEGGGDSSEESPP